MLELEWVKAREEALGAMMEVQLVKVWETKLDVAWVSGSGYWLAESSVVQRGSRLVDAMDNLKAGWKATWTGDWSDDDLDVKMVGMRVVLMAETMAWIKAAMMAARRVATMD